VTGFVCGCQKKREEHDSLDMTSTLESFASRGLAAFTGRCDSSITDVLDVFRDLCALVWMLGCRDSLSLILRRKELNFEDQQVHQPIFSRDQLIHCHCQIT